MKNVYLYLIGIAMALLTLVWTWNQCGLKYQSAVQAFQMHQDCKADITEIKSLMAASEGSAQIAPQGFDPAQMVTAAVRKSGISSANFSVSQSRARKIAQTNIRQWKVQVPSTSTTLTNALKFVQKLAESDLQFQVERLDLRPDLKNSGGNEHWKTDFSIFYLKRDEAN